MKLQEAIDQVAEWNERFGHLSGDSQKDRNNWEENISTRSLAVDLVVEEVQELHDACLNSNDNYIETLDAVVDILVTAFGLAAKAGLKDKIEPAFEEVMRANWSKADENGNPVFLPSGKIAKSNRYTPPNLEQFFGEEE